MPHEPGLLSDQSFRQRCLHVRLAYELPVTHAGTVLKGDELLLEHLEDGPLFDPQDPSSPFIILIKNYYNYDVNIIVIFY